MKNNMTVTLEDNVLVIHLPINKDLKPSTSGKTLVVASSHGSQITDVEIQGKKVVVGVNAYISNR